MKLQLFIIGFQAYNPLSLISSSVHISLHQSPWSPTATNFLLPIDLSSFESHFPFFCTVFYSSVADSFIITLYHLLAPSLIHCWLIPSTITYSQSNPPYQLLQTCQVASFLLMLNMICLLNTIPHALCFLLSFVIICQLLFHSMFSSIHI